MENQIKYQEIMVNDSSGLPRDNFNPLISSLLITISSAAKPRESNPRSHNFHSKSIKIQTKSKILHIIKTKMLHTYRQYYAPWY